MAKWKIVLLAGIIAASALPSQAQYGWFEQSSGTSNWLNAVHFVDSLTGWAVGDYYTIRKTTDGGQTWFSQSFGQGGDWSDIFFVDENTGWLTGKQGQIYKSTDGGSNWQIQHLNYAWSSISCSDAMHCWAVGSFGWIVATTDGGANWTAQTSPTSNYLNEVFFIDNNRGWAVGNSATIIRTTNGGTNWFSVTDSDLYCDLNSIHFTDPDSGFAGGDCSIFASTNGGGSNGWTDKWPTSYPGDINSVYFVNGRQGWIAGTGGDIWATTDGGDTWNQQTSPYNSTLMDIHFVNERQGWAVGWGGEILHTGTGGITATMEERPANWSILTFPNPFLGEATLRLELPAPQTVEIKITDVMGREVLAAAAVRMNAGTNNWRWGANLPAGCYRINLSPEKSKPLTLSAIKIN